MVALEAFTHANIAEASLVTAPFIQELLEGTGQQCRMYAVADMLNQSIA